MNAVADNSGGVDPHAPQPVSPAALVRSLWRNRQLIFQMTKRDVIGRYKGSVLGLTWSFFNPLFMLSVYTFVFTEVFHSRWGNATSHENKAQFAILLFVGMIVLTLFSDVVNRAPGLILANVNYVKKVVFPIETLPVVALGTAMFHALVSLLVLLVAIMVFNDGISWTIVLFPLVFVPLMMLTVGLAWLLASMGVFLRDVSQTVVIITTVMLFLAPVFYPMSAVPARFRVFILMNPLTFIIEQARMVLVWGKLPNWLGLGIYMMTAMVIAWLGFVWFQKTRKGFSDVL